MPHNNTVKALNSHNEVVIGYLADSKTISIVEGSGKGIQKFCQIQFADISALLHQVHRSMLMTSFLLMEYIKELSNSENNLTSLGIIKFAIISNGFLQIVIVKQMRLTI